MDNVRRAEVSRTIKLDTVEEAFTSKNWIVRIYKVRLALGGYVRWLWVLMFGGSNRFPPAAPFFLSRPPRSLQPRRPAVLSLGQVKDLDNLGRNMTIAARYDAGDKEADALRREQQKRTGKRRSHLVA